MTRVIQGLKWAKTCDRPKVVPIGRARGAKREGLKYEAKVAQSLPNAQHGQWFEFEDAFGPGWCQPDLLLNLRPRSILLLEVKYSYRSDAFDQLERLYRPVVEAALGTDPYTAQVCKRLTPHPQGVIIVSDLRDVISLSARGVRVVLHWLGVSSFPSLEEVA